VTTEHALDVGSARQGILVEPGRSSSVGIDRTICPNCRTSWPQTKPPIAKVGFDPCELLHGPNGTGSVYADLLFAFANGEIAEWSNEGQYTQISGDGPPWVDVVDGMEPPEQPLGAPLTERQVKRLERIDWEIRRLRG